MKRPSPLWMIAALLLLRIMGAAAALAPLLAELRQWIPILFG